MCSNNLKRRGRNPSYSTSYISSYGKREGFQNYEGFTNGTDQTMTLIGSITILIVLISLLVMFLRNKN